MGKFRACCSCFGSLDLGTVKSAGVRQLSRRTFHALRHSFTSALANQGVAPELRMKLTGHKTEAAHRSYTRRAGFVDLAEMKDGVFHGLNMSEEEQDLASQNVYVTLENQRTGSALFSEVVGPLLREIKPDLLWLDPALSYLGGDMNNQKDVGPFLRNQLGPVLLEYNCGAVVIHHTNKISNSPDKPIIDPAYLGAGSAEWANWSRAVLALRKTDVANLYELVCGKRGQKLKWRAADGEALTFTKYIGHCKRPDTICWIEMAIAEAEELKAGNGKTTEDVLKHVPQNNLVAKDDLIKICRQNGMGKNLVADFINDLLNDDQLFEHAATRPGKRPKVLLARSPATLPNPLPLDAYTRNSEGHYFEPTLTEPAPKTL